MPENNIVTLLSGGLDSSVLLFHLLEKNPDANVHALSFDYGQRHRIELEAASVIVNAACRQYGVHTLEYDLIDLTSVGRLLSGSSLVDREVEVPEGHYESETMKATVVPNRNMMMLAIGASIAVSDNAHLLTYAAHAGDHAIYPDCRPQFTDALLRAIAYGNEGFLNPDFKMESPFIAWSKADIVARGFELGVPFEKTWTCYKGRRPACGRCSTCVERLEAFDHVSLTDPLVYRDRTFYKSVV
jgi:7-cyano-7-deazaguanine synthase